MNNPQSDAFRDMTNEDLDMSTMCSLDIQDIVDPIVLYGFEATRRVFLDFKRRKCDALGSLVLGVSRESEFPERNSKGLMKALAADYCVTETFLLGVEAGFNNLSTNSDMSNNEYRKGFLVGTAAWKNLTRPPLQPGVTYEA